MKSHHAYQLAAMKAALVERILEGSISVTDAARSVKKSRFAIYEWMTKYKASGIDGLLPGKTGNEREIWAHLGARFGPTWVLQR